ncbi:hypothetical protein HPB48_025175 [Haemaphysalis longicornis]|uniref:Uncharacterized protein n=1 Tax=Haemaphysalis longicornis TaxID=44386 RepID=A0A9J6H9A0_HAELO|nr:hypothetical protein HPB48_025175 [Haemaphysalis longicornis]
MHPVEVKTSPGDQQSSPLVVWERPWRGRRKQKEAKATGGGTHPERGFAPSFRNPPSAPGRTHVDSPLPQTVEGGEDVGTTADGAKRDSLPAGEDAETARTADAQ